jgi:hypothetical protein
LSTSVKEEKKKHARDYSENVFQEFNMVTLESLYHRSLIELDEFRLFFNIPAPNSKANIKMRSLIFSKLEN